MATGTGYDKNPQIGKSCMPENVEPVHWGGSGKLRDYLKTINERNEQRAKLIRPIEKKYDTTDETAGTLKFL